MVVTGIYGDAYVYFEDGRQEKLKDVVGKKLEGRILTLNEKTGAFEYSEIIGHYKTGTIENNDDLLNIQTEGLGKKDGAKNGVVSIAITPLQRVLTKKGWVEAKELSSNDSLVSSYTSLEGQIKDILYAIAAGDSHILADSKNSKNTAALLLNDSENPEYLKWKIGKLSHAITFHLNSLGFKSEYIHDFKLLKEAISTFDAVYNIGRNPLPFLEEHFSPLGFAIWIMDDGYFDEQDNFYVLSIARFASYKPVLRVVSHWLDKYGYKNSLIKDGGIRFNKESAYKIARDICRFVPKCMEYKLPKAFRNKYEEFELEYKNIPSPEYVKIKSKKEASERQMNKLRGIYALTTEGNHNYMVGNHSNGIVVKA